MRKLGAQEAETSPYPLRRIVSGGQTGVDRAALDVAMRLGLACGGWCPQGRRAEDGKISAGYPLVETPTPEYEERTLWNVRDSDGTLILHCGNPAGGTALTAAYARIEQKPHLLVDLSAAPSIEPVRVWLTDFGIRVLNVAGPRESTAPGIYILASQFLEALLAGP